MTLRILLVIPCAIFLCVSVVGQEPAAPKKKPATSPRPVARNAAEQLLQAIKKAADAQRAATRKLVKAQQETARASGALAAAEKAATTASSDEEKQAAAKAIAAARKKLDATREAMNKQRTVAVRAAQVAAAFRTRTTATPSVEVREDVDPQDGVERIALLTPGGPLIIEVAMTIDDQPFRVAREKLIDKMLAAADQNKDGKATWDEALKTTRFTLGRVRLGNPQQTAYYIRASDLDADGLVDRRETRQFLARYSQGPAFTLLTRNRYTGTSGRVVFLSGRVVDQNSGAADVRKLLDTDTNGVLDDKEIAAAPERLKSRDADDNDLLVPGEIRGTDRAAADSRVDSAAGRTTPPRQLAVLLGPTAKAAWLFARFHEHYENKDGDIVAASFTALPEIFESLDENDDGKLQQDEMLALNTIKPHIELDVDLAQAKGAKGLTLKSLAPKLVKTSASNKSILLELPGIKVTLNANVIPRPYNFAQTGKAYLMRLDKDNNGYLDKDEGGGNFAQQFGIWDADEDGKVFPEEIVASYARMLAPQLTQVRANTVNRGNPLFEALDLSGDGRLSLREMRTATQRIQAFDEDKDSRVTPQEIPVALSVTFGLGNSGTTVDRTTSSSRPGADRPAINRAPEWFTRMDRNGDGDITLKEFLGDKNDFARLDGNNDGFVEPGEAKLADSKPR